MVLILFFILLLAYVAAFLGAEQRKEERVLRKWWAASLAVAVCASGVFAWILFSAELSRRATQVAWIGMSARRAEDSLQIGGSRQKSSIGWPNGSFSPSVELGPPRQNEASISINGAGGFVRGPQGFLNGIPFGEGTRAQAGGYALDSDSIPSRLCLRCRAAIHVFDPAGNKVATIEPRVGGDPRVSSLYSNLTVDIARLRKTDPAAAQALESWSSNFRLLVSRSGLRVLGPEADAVSAQLTLPAQLTVYWIGQAQPVDVEATSDGRIEATFLPPWRLASPLPEATREGDSHLTLESRALPGDSAFLVPLGGDLGSMSQTVSLKNAQFARPDKTAHTKEFEKIVSQETVYAGKYALLFAAIHDLPGWPRVAGILLLALAIYGWGLGLASARMRWRDGWVLGGILASIWTILLIRLLLAFRYSIDPAHFDKFAFDGVASAARALCLIPALILIAARLRRDRVSRFDSETERTSAGRNVLLYIVGTAVASSLAPWIAHSLWPNVEARYTHLSLSLSLLFTASLVTLALLWVVGYILFLYFYDPEREVTERFRAKLEQWRARFLRRITETFALEQSEGFWRHLGSTLDDDEEYDQRDYKTRLKVLSLVLLTLVGAAVLIGGIGWATGGTEKFLQEVAAPFLLCWMPACVWLAARLRFRPGSRMSRRSMGWIVPWLLAAVLLILAPVVLFPVLLGDAGGIVAAFAFFWPAVALLAAGGKPRRLQWMPMGVLLFAVLCAGVVYLNIDYVTTLPGEARVRLLIFKEGMNLQDRLPGLPMLKEDASRAPTVRQVSQGLQHTWENKAIAHEGGWLGLGFGKAPARRSQVPQHTLQVDSTYSFYIASEFGLAGGLALWAVYAMPLIWVLISARPRFDAGHGLATLIASAFLLEAVFHAGMNLTAFPYTGRDLPLLAVGSFTDSVRWTLLFCLAVRALQWRAIGRTAGVEAFQTESIISPPALPGAPESVREPVGRYRFAVVAVTALPLLLAGYSVFREVQIVLDPELSRPFQWTRLLNAIRRAGDEGKLKVDPKTMTIEVADASLAQQGGSLMEQEIARFNALTESEKLEGAGGGSAEFRRRLRQVRTVADYDKLLLWLRSQDDQDRPDQRPLLFKLGADPRTIDEAGQVPVADRSFQILPNPAFNTSISFHELRKEDIPAVSLRGQASGTFVVRGRDFEFHVPNLPAKVYNERTITLEEASNGAFRKIADTNPDAPSAVLQIRYKPEKRAKPIFTFGELRVANGGITFRPAVDSRLIHAGSSAKKLGRNVLTKMAAGDRAEVAFAIGKNKIQPAFSVEKTAQGALIGPAWVMGNWVPTYDPDPLIPWTANLANALPDEQVRLKKELPARMGTLTFDKALQASLQAFATEKGREHYREYLGTARAGRQPLPPRVAISVIALPRGEVIGLGGWPRMNSGRHWETGPAGDSIPPFTWVDGVAPHSLQIRYQGDRNFDRIAVGSASKPLWASAVLRLHRGLENKLAVRGGDEEENDVFGIQIPGKPWAVHPSGWHGLAEYLSVSDNRYQVRLGFLGLTRPNPERPSEITAGASSTSTKESLDGGQSAWQHYPAFDDVDFLPAQPGHMRGLEQSKLAERLKAMYGVGIETGEIVHRRSFWTGDEANDWEAASKAQLSQALEYTAPEAPNFEFNRIESPRRFITLLLGGGANLWANVDFAGAFGTCVLGLPVIPHVTRLDAGLLKPTKERGEGFENPQQLLNGLRDVVDASSGTANPYLRATRGLNVLQGMAGVRHYAKTGTLGAEQGGGNVSRIVLALVKGDKKGAETGLVISVVVEHANLGTATTMLGEFLVQHEQDLRRLMGLK